MYYIKKQISVPCAHKLNLNYEGRCTNLHGHNFKITVFCKSEILDENQMVADFDKIKSFINTNFDHKYLNDVLQCNPTSESFAKFLCDKIPNCYKVTIEESQGNEATYEVD